MRRGRDWGESGCTCSWEIWKSSRFTLLYIFLFATRENIRSLYHRFVSDCLCCSAGVPLDPSSLCSERHKQVLTAADCFDIHLIAGTTSQSDSSSEQHNIFHARGRSQINHFLLTINKKKRWLDDGSSWQLWLWMLRKDGVHSDTAEPLNLLYYLLYNLTKSKPATVHSRQFYI